MLPKNPEHYNEISIIYEIIWKNLIEGVNDRNSDFHTFALATTNNDKVSVRTIVLRNCNKKDLYISFHTNNTSKKIKEIKKNPNVECLFYSKNEKIQIRISGIAKIFNDDHICHKIWKNLKQDARNCYLIDKKSGSLINSPADVHQEHNNEASKNFSLININIKKIEWLYLSSSGHRRVSFNEHNLFKGNWIVP